MFDTLSMFAKRHTARAARAKRGQSWSSAALQHERVGWSCGSGRIDLVARGNRIDKFNELFFYVKADRT